MNFPLIILGAGGHAKVVINALGAQSKIIGITDADLQKIGQVISSHSVIGNDQAVLRYSPADVQLVNGLGSITSNQIRSAIFNRFKDLDYRFFKVIHHTAIIASDCFLHEGVQIMAGVIIQPGCVLGKNVLINTGAIIEHDCQLGSHVHVAPGVTLSGGITIGENAHIGVGATIIQGVKVGSNSVVAAGATVIHDVPEYAKVAGVPARQIS